MAKIRRLEEKMRAYKMPQIERQIGVNEGFRVFTDTLYLQP